MGLGQVKSLLFFGYGYVAQHLKAFLEPQGDWKFLGTKRADYNEPGITIVSMDDLLLIPRDTTHILISIPPQDDGDIAFHEFSRQIEKLQNLEWLGYLSTTGVYGNTNGAWVDESSPVNPGTPFAKKRVIAEEQWLNFHEVAKIPTHIFRISGIYGEGRNVADQVKAGTARIIDKPEQVFSRIHVDDIIQTLYASMHQPNPGSIYNLADDYPSNPRESIEYICQKLNITPPTPVKLEDSGLSEMAKSFYSQSRRVRNNKIKTELGVKLRYPSFREFY